MKSKHTIGSLSGRLDDTAAAGNGDMGENSSGLENLCEYDLHEGEDDWQVL